MPFNLRPQDVMLKIKAEHLIEGTLSSCKIDKYYDVKIGNMGNWIVKLIWEVISANNTSVATGILVVSVAPLYIYIYIYILTF